MTRNARGVAHTSVAGGRRPSSPPQTTRERGNPIGAAPFALPIPGLLFDRRRVDSNRPVIAAPASSSAAERIVRRRILLGPAAPGGPPRLTQRDLAEINYQSPLARRLLDPIDREWLADQGTDHAYSNLNALRTGLVRELSRRWVEAARREFPGLEGFLPLDQFRTIAFLRNLDSDFDGGRLENAASAALASELIARGTIIKAFTTGKLPITVPTMSVFANPWKEWTRGMIGICAELETAVGIDPRFVQSGQKVRMSQDFDIRGEIGGVRKQDADVSFVDISGRKVLVEVAATVERLREKMGAEGADQRARYERLRRHEHAELAYSVAGIGWTNFFTGDRGTSIAERLPLLDRGWGLIIQGQYVSPARLLAVATIMRGAERQYGGGFLAALRASDLRLTDVEQMQPDALARRLRRYGR